MRQPGRGAQPFGVVRMVMMMDARWMRVDGSSDEIVKGAFVVAVAGQVKVKVDAWLELADRIVAVGGVRRGECLNKVTRR